VTTDFSGAGSSDEATALVRQPDGKLVAGSAEPSGAAFASGRPAPQRLRGIYTGRTGLRA